jgi:hypothetical protein
LRMFCTVLGERAASGAKGDWVSAGRCRSTPQWHAGDSLAF